jgi:hypothetical protein
VRFIRYFETNEERTHVSNQPNSLVPIKQHCGTFFLCGAAAQRGLWPPHPRGFENTHTTRHNRKDSSGRVISSSQRPLPDNTQHSKQTDIHAPGGIRAHNLSRRAGVDLRHRPRGHLDRHCGKFRNCKHNGTVPAFSIIHFPISRKPHVSRKSDWYTKCTHQSKLQLYPEKSFSNKYLRISG